MGSNKKSSVGAYKKSCQLVLLVGSNKKSSVGAYKSYCMNFDSFKIVNSSLP